MVRVSPPVAMLATREAEGQAMSTDIETLTLAQAVAAGLSLDERHPVDGRLIVPIHAGELAFVCAQVADAGGRHEAMIERLAERTGYPGAAPPLRRFAAWIAQLCDEVATRHPAAPGDAIAAAFEWTGWCHRLGHGNAVQMRVRIIGAPQLTTAQRAQARARVSNAVLRELKTPDATFVAHQASQERDGSRWARRWKEVLQQAMAEAFDGASPAGVHARFAFTSSPF